ncbi:hypothetical protein [Actinoplanes sp. URMC 104]|uniref:hypothetical protein n=1 Tax=Actinoplanes sp. URMC 104 TaxID=3423409 RepID=UPI003F1E24BA
MTTDTGFDPADRRPCLAAAVSGILFFLGAWLVPAEGPSPATATAAQIRDHVAANDVALRVGAAAELAGVVLFVVFVAAVAQLIRNRRPASLLAGLFLAGGLLLAVHYLLMAVVDGMLRLLPGLIGVRLDEIDDATLRGWYALGGVTHFLGDLAMAPTALVLAAAALAAFLPRWLTWATALVAASAVIGTVGIVTAWSALYPFWFGGQFGWALWIVTVAVVCAVRARRLRRASLDRPPAGAGSRSRTGVG